MLGAEDGLKACGGRGVSRRWIACCWRGAATSYKDGAGVLWCARSTGGLARLGASVALQRTLAGARPPRAQDHTRLA